MAKDDYFVMAYKLLQYLYSCLKKSQKPNLNYIKQESKFFPVSKEYFDYLIEHLVADEYIENVYIQPADDTVIIVIDESVRITPKGIEYLQENSTMKKVARAIKDAREMIP